MSKIKAVVGFSGGNTTASGIMPGTTVWARVRTAGLKGMMGAWSDPAKAESDDTPRRLRLVPVTSAGVS